MTIKKQYEHQAVFVQAPYVYTALNFFFLVGGYGCVHGDTRIETTKGKIKIRDFDGGEILTFDKNSKKITTQYAKKAVRQGTAPLYEVATNEGKKILVTRSHQFLTPTGYVSLEDLSVGDLLLAYDAEPLLLSCDSYMTSIKNISYIGDFDYYDLHVPVYNNYLAEGMVHHNCGKTSALVDSVLRAIKAFAGKKDLEGRTPKIGVCGITLTFLKKTFAGALIQVFDATKTRYNYDKANNIIYVAGVELHLTAIIEEKDIFGYDWCCAFVDELDELETYKAINVVRAINERTRQVIPGARPAFISFATTSQGLKGTYQVVKSFERDGIGYFLIRGETKANTALDKKKVEDMYKLYSKKEVECLLEGKFVSIDSGKPYPDYDPVKCKMRSDLFDSVEENETIYIGQDFNSGFNKAVALIIREGIIFAIKEYSFPDLRSAPKVMRYDFPKNLIKWIPDATGSEKVMLFKKELRANGIKVMMRSRNPPIQDRTFLVNKLFYSGRMFVCPFCKDLDNALVIRQNDPKTGLPMKGKTESAPDHLCFAGETKIATNKGLVRIDNIKIGDMILTRNGYKKCTASMKTGHKEVHKYRIGDKTICCTEDHPIFTVDSGMLPAKDLTRSSMCVTLNTWHTESLSYSIVSASSAPESVRVGMMDVYNITVEGDHEYFADGVLVSNCDALEYAITYMVLWLRELKDIYTVTLGRRIEKRIEAGLSNAEDENYVDDGLGVT